MKTEKEIRDRIKSMEKEAKIIRFVDGHTEPRPMGDCGWAIFGTKIHVLKWVLGEEPELFPIETKEA